MSIIRVPTDPKMLFTPSGFYCTYCDYYFYADLDRSGLPDLPVRWSGQHGAEGRDDCPLRLKSFEIDVTDVYPESRKV